MAAVLFFLYVCFSERMNVCVHVSSCLRGAVLHFVRVCCALCVHLPFTDGGCRVHDH